jgi:hypothetical protein
MMFELRPPPLTERFICSVASIHLLVEENSCFHFKLLSVVILHSQWCMFEDDFAIAIAYIV